VVRVKSLIAELLPILALALVPPIVVWLPFFLGLQSVGGVPLTSGGMGVIVQNYDGPLYIVVAKTLYNATLIKQSFSFNLPVEYYAAHFPFFPVLIRAIATLTHIGFPYSMLVATLLGSILSLFYFRRIAKDYFGESNALWLTAIFAIFPARWLIVRSVGSPEPLFVGSIIASVYYFRHKKYWLAGIWGAIAQITKSPGIIIFAAYMAVLLLPSIKHAASTSISKFTSHFPFRAYPVLLIPLSLVGVFFIYQLTYNNFFAYFNSGDNIHLFFPPFQIFNYSQPWVGTFWLEEVIFVYLFALIGIVELIKQKNRLFLAFIGIFFGTIIFVSHRDIIRYALPIVPFLILTFGEQLSKKEYRYVFIFLAVPIYLFSLAYISQNHMLISDWAPLL
jgi:Gpi18-like mannosyltransferase